ncbi:FAD-binding oxidoreductase [Cupriavidus necator]|uniref:FAD-binding oxidoreductase n=1 Tax=Cupriavidus necator TaxID=106590 RepID=UPI0027862172|nr:FAD-binding oxidoreductase [Cupriavidus necator]MDQ0141187.1 FAD/FMN-containing dehydrogenase [Cupriavidus necator]
MSLVSALQASLSAGGVITNAEDMAPYLSDWRGMFHGDAVCVVRPANVAELARVVTLASEQDVAIVPQGGNTGLAGGATPLQGRRQLLLSLTRMSRIRSIDRAGMTMAVEAGCVLETAKLAAAKKGRQLPIGFAAEGSATIGGMLSTNAGGVNALRYGTARQLVLGLEAVLADGTIVDGMRNLRKDNAGYDWKQILIGSEGTLGIITAAVLRLAPVAKERAVAFVALDSPEHALELLEFLHDRVGDAVTAFELMSRASADRVVAFVGGRIPCNAAPWYVLVETSDHAPDLAGRLESALADFAENTGSLQDAAVAQSISQAKEMWALRENMGEAERHAGRSVKHDVAVGVSDVPAFMAEASRAVMSISNGLDINAFGHLGDGNIHFNVLGSADRETDYRINHTVHDVVSKFNGSIAAEHGIGQYRVKELQRVKSATEHMLMMRLKTALDPDSLLNPGKILPRSV